MRGDAVSEDMRRDMRRMKLYLLDSLLKLDEQDLKMRKSLLAPGSEVGVGRLMDDVEDNYDEQPVTPLPKFHIPSTGSHSHLSFSIFHSHHLFIFPSHHISTSL